MLWVESHIEDFKANQELVDMLHDFADSVLMSASQSKVAVKLKEQLAAKLAGDVEEELPEFTVDPPFSIVSPKCINEGKYFYWLLF